MLYASLEPAIHPLFATESPGDDVGMMGVSYAYHVSKSRHRYVIGMALVWRSKV